MNKSPEIEAFYVSYKWRKCRTAYAKSVGNMCERCRKKGIIEVGSKKNPLEAHHKIPLTVDNIHDPEITLNWDNMELVCKKCHDEEKKKKPKRWKVGQDGKVVIGPHR